MCLNALISVGNFLLGHMEVRAAFSISVQVVPRDVVRARAKLLDQELSAGQVRGLMHGIPIIVKDIFPPDIDLGMPTTCGAYAFRSAYAKENCPLVQSLLDAGMIIIGNSNLNENCRLRDVDSGWSALGGQSQSPYVEGGQIQDEAPIGNTSISGSSLVAPPERSRLAF